MAFVVAFGVSTVCAHAAVAPRAIVAYAPHAAGIGDLGRADARTSVRLAVLLKYRNETALDQLLDMQSDPDSPQHDNVLTADQFRNAFSPTQQRTNG